MKKKQHPIAELHATNLHIWGNLGKENPQILWSVPFIQGVLSAYVHKISPVGIQC